VAWFVFLVFCLFSLEFGTYGYDNRPGGVLDLVMTDITCHFARVCVVR